MRIHDHFSKIELQQLLARSDAQAWLAVLTSWVLVALAFALVALWPNPLTILLALIVIGGRQLGFGALMHECGHGSLFATKGLNSWVGKWLCAGPVMYRIDDYMVRHLLHHRHALHRSVLCSPPGCGLIEEAMIVLVPFEPFDGGVRRFGRAACSSSSAGR